MQGNVDLALLCKGSKIYIISSIIIAIFCLSFNVIAETLVILVLYSTDHVEMCTCATRVLSHLFGPSRRRFSFSIPQAQLSLFRLAETVIPLK